MDHAELVKLVRDGLSRKTGVGGVGGGQVFSGAWNKTKRMSVNQACVREGTVIFTEDERTRVALSIVRNIMGDGMSSRLFQTVREKMGLVYGIRAMTETYDEGIGFCIGYKAEPGKAALACEAVREEMGKMWKDGFEKDEVRRAKDALCGQMRLVHESALNRMMVLGERELNKRKPMDISALVRRIDSINMTEIREAIDMIEDVEDWSYAAVVPKEWRGKIWK